MSDAERADSVAEVLRLMVKHLWGWGLMWTLWMLSLFTDPWLVLPLLAAFIINWQEVFGNGVRSPGTRPIEQ